MRVSIDPGKQYSAFALITAEHGPRRLYLLQWNTKWQVFNLIGGKLDEKDEKSLARTIYRELEEELGLRREEECLIINQIQQIEMKQFSFREQREKVYHFGIFEVDLFPRLNLDQSTKINAARWLSTGRENIFVSKSEIENLSTVNGRPISATTREILRRLGELPKPGNDALPLGISQTTTAFQPAPEPTDFLELRLERTENALRTLIAHSHITLTQSNVGQVEEQAQATYRRLMQHIPALLCELMPDGTVLFVNDAIRPLTGYEPHELIGRNWWRIFFPDNGGHHVNQLYRLLHQGDVQDYRTKLRGRNGRAISIHWTTTNQYGPDGQLQRIIAFGIDRANSLIDTQNPAYRVTQISS